MKYIYIIIFASLFQTSFGQKEKYFTNESLRIDFILSGDHSSTFASIYEIKKQPFWNGSPKTQDRFNLGEFKVIVKDSATQKVIYTRGFCTLFEEWQDSEDADINSKAFQQTIEVPFPIHTIILNISKRDEFNNFTEIVNTQINPDDYYIIKNTLPTIHTQKIIDNGDPSQCVDIAFLSDGYSKDEMNKFHQDIKKLTDYLFSQAPFNKYKDRFNIWAVDVVSPQSGVSDPRKNIWKNTALHSSFNTLNSDRYLESLHTFDINDYAEQVPHDQIYVLANTTKYGGGGIFNHFSLTSVDNSNSFTVFIHEFGHAFAGLADEYFYEGATNYDTYYNDKTEPWNPNITNMVDFVSKWKDMMDPKTPIPTPAKEKYFNKVGAFEGGGYVTKGIYRPYFDCRMRSNEATSFCPVCQRAIENMILFLSGN